MVWRGFWGVYGPQCLQIYFTTIPVVIQLQNKRYYINFYKKLSGLDLPSKLKITFWCITKKILPTLCTLQFKRITSSSLCSRCAGEAETSIHALRDFPIRRWESKNWSPLEHPLVKINFDAALWESSSFVTEALACVQSLQWGLDLGFL